MWETTLEENRCKKLTKTNKTRENQKKSKKSKNTVIEKIQGKWSKMTQKHENEAKIRKLNAL